MRVMVLAAGRGARMRELTALQPKPLVPVAGRALIDHLLTRLAQASLREVVVNLGYRGAQLREHLGDGARFGLHIRYSDEGDPALETGGGIHRALPLLGDAPFAVVNADVWCDFPLERLADIAAHLAAGDLAHLLLVDNPPQHPNGDFGYRQARASAEPSAPRLTFSGISVMRPALFDGCAPGRFPLAPLLQRAVGDGRVAATHYTGRWADIGTPERLHGLERSLAASGVAGPAA